MNQTAYLVIFIETGTGQFKGVGIYSEDGASLTITDRKVVPATVLSCTDNDYESASNEIRDACKRYSHLQWLIPYLDGDPFVRPGGVSTEMAKALKDFVAREDESRAWSAADDPRLHGRAGSRSELAARAAKLVEQFEKKGTVG